jgi:putative transposase
VKFGFIVKHRGLRPTAWLCEALGVSRGGFYAWLTRPPSHRARRDEVLGAKIRVSFRQSDRTYGARRVWHDLLAEGETCGLHRIERLMRRQALWARPRRRRVPADVGTRSPSAVSPNVLNRQFAAPAPNRKWVADFTYLWTAEGWLYHRGSLLPTSGGVVHKCDDDVATGRGCIGDGDLAERHAQGRLASHGSRQPVHQRVVPVCWTIPTGFEPPDMLSLIAVAGTADVL